jgi:hypothetical protein
MFKSFVSLVLLLSFSTNLVMEWDGVASSGEASFSNFEQCLDTISGPCECPDGEDCSGDGCQDCHCCHNHVRYLTQSPLLAMNKSAEETDLSRLRDTFYSQPFLESNRRPPKKSL